jgi:hypothetical protein
MSEYYDPRKAIRAMHDTDRPALAMERAALTFAIQTELVDPVMSGEQPPVGWSVADGAKIGEVVLVRDDGARISYDSLAAIDPGLSRSSQPFCSIVVPAGVWGITDTDTPKTVAIKGAGDVASYTRELRVDERGRAQVWSIGARTDELTINALKQYLFPDASA